jgi:hypothetical protein
MHAHDPQCNRRMERWSGIIASVSAIAIGLVLWSWPGFALAVEGGQRAFEMEADGSYTLRAGDTRIMCEHLAVFQAKRTVVEAAETYFSRRERINFLGKKRDEIVNYTADRVAFRVLQEKWNEHDSPATYRVRLKVWVQPSDFIEAEIESLHLEKADSDESLRKELEPSISARSLPGHDIAAAYRRIRKGALRPAIIYLDRLQRKYPNWSDIYEVKALALDLHNEPQKMKSALEKACELGSPTSCSELKTLATDSER